MIESTDVSRENKKRVLSVHPALNVVRASGTELCTASFIAVAHALARSQRLQTLDVSDNLQNKSDASPSNHRVAILHLAKAIADNTSLRSLRLSKLGICDEDMLVDLGNAIMLNKGLQDVDLSKYFPNLFFFLSLNIIFRTFPPFCPRLLTFPLPFEELGPSRFRLRQCRYIAIT